MASYIRWILLILIIAAASTTLLAVMLTIDPPYEKEQLPRENVGQITGNYAEAVSTHFPDQSDSYRLLLENPRIRSAIEANPLVRDVGSVDYVGVLAEHLDAIESDDIARWNGYRTACPDTLSQRDRDLCMRDIYLRKVTVSLYVEANQIVPWSLLEYTDEELDVILGDLYQPAERYKRSSIVLSNGNPILPYEYVEELRTLFPERSINTQKDLLDLTIIRMRADGWRHATGSSKPKDVCGSMHFDFECLVDRKKGSDSITAGFLYAVLQSHNVPAVHEPRFLHGHTGLRFPSLGLIMRGNDVYDLTKAGRYTGPNPLPIDYTYLDLDTYARWNQLELCEAWYFLTRQESLQYLSAYDDPTWNGEILFAYCLNDSGYEPGEALRMVFSRRVAAPWDCLPEENPDAVGDMEPPLTEDELDEWMDRIGAVADC